MSALLDALARGPCSLSSGDVRLDGAALLEQSRELSRELEGVRPGPIALWLDNGPQWALADLALLWSQRACVPVPRFFHEQQRAHVLEATGARFALTDGPEACEGLGVETGPTVSVADGLWLVELETPPGPATTLPERTSKITFTSGTTARPKGVCLSQQTLEAVAASIVGALGAEPPRRHLCALPLPILLENVAGLWGGLLAGAECLLPPLSELGWNEAGGLEPVKFATAVKQARPESLILVPELLLALVAGAEAGLSPPDSLRFVAVGGARVAPRLIERAHAVGIPVFEGYGLSECASVVTLNAPGCARPGSVGQPLPHARVRIDDDGEVRVSGAVMEGYLGSQPRSDEEYATGDLGHFDEDGYLYIHGRTRSVFITSLGRNVSPEWVESELTQSIAIAQAAVFGEERPWAIAVLVARGEPDEEKLAAAVAEANERLPGYARVGGWLVADAPFDANNGLATANGRVRRDAVRNRYSERIDALWDQEESP